MGKSESFGDHAIDAETVNEGIECDHVGLVTHLENGSKKRKGKGRVSLVAVTIGQDGETGNGKGDSAEVELELGDEGNDRGLMTDPDNSSQKHVESEDGWGRVGSEHAIKRKKGVVKNVKSRKVMEL
ncbi:unnamed protein product [Sphenostylis stenocarpa]|uniref:Uncharacterized protein n=1 Tax=Sphenostylis stenocarpa TaxID=92480 RepID=A0AA86VGH2_9FABA|nr:unnamed protein product [Sphenostylis stenocarpa]